MMDNDDIYVLLDGDGVLLDTGAKELLVYNAQKRVEEETLGKRGAAVLQDVDSPSRIVVGAVEGRDYATFSLSYVIYRAASFVP